MRKLIIVVTITATLSAPLAAEASPWGWVEHHATKIAQGVVGAGAVIGGLVGYSVVGGAIADAVLAGGTTAAVALGMGAILPLAAGALIAIGGYEIYEALSQKQGSDVGRNAETRGFLPQDRPFSAANGNIGMHH